MILKCKKYLYNNNFPTKSLNKINFLNFKINRQKKKIVTNRTPEKKVAKSVETNNIDVSCSHAFRMSL